MKRFVGFLAVAVLLLSPTGVFANVFAFDVSVSPPPGVTKISYRLNEAATSVVIEIFGPLPDTTVIRHLNGTTTKGLNTVPWNGQDDSSNPADPSKTYGFKIVATDSTGHAAWDVISDDTQKVFQFYAPRGVAVNKNVGSLYFGRIYVCEMMGGQTSAGSATRLTNDGIYILYPDGSDPTGQGDTGLAGGVDWITATDNYSSPYRVNIGPDDNAYISDWSDAHSGLWRGNPDCSGSFEQILDNTGRAASGLCGNHGSIAVAWIEGTGASTAVYVDDEDYLGGGTAARAYSVWKHSIGTGPFPITAAPTVAIDDDVLNKFVNDMGAGLIRDAAGKWYRTQDRWGGTDASSVFQISADGTTVLWASIADGAGGATPDPLRGAIGGCALDEARSRFFVAISAPPNGDAQTGGFAVLPIPLPVGDLATKMTVVEWTDANTRGVDCDLAGNVYLVDNVNERLRIYSPPDGANSYTTESDLTLTPGEAGYTGAKHWALYE
jgi:hypothetical protein